MFQVASCMMDQLGQMESNLLEVGQKDVRVPLHQMEMQRVRFLLTSYWRIRLEKIQRFIHTLDPQGITVLFESRVASLAYVA